MQSTEYSLPDGTLRRVTDIFHMPGDEPAESVLRRRYERAVEQVFKEKGELLSIKQGKVGRNDPCPCGSGRKFKRCCESKLRVAIATNGH